MKQYELFNARKTDPETSQIAAGIKRDSQCHLLLQTYGNCGALTDDEASRIAGIKYGWKRCADLRKLGFIEQVDTIEGDNGTPVMVCHTTFSGRRELGLLA